MVLSNEHAERLARQAAKESANYGDAYAQLYAAYHRRLVGYLAGSLVRNRDDAEEVAQEAWLRLLKAIARTKRSPMPIKNWLFLQGKRVAIDRIRSRRKLREAMVDLSGPADDDFSLDELAVDPAPLVADLLDQWDTQRQLLRIAFRETDSPPWELEVYGFHRYFGWTPGELTAEEFVLPFLRALAERLIADFHAKPEFEPGNVDDAFERLRAMVEAEPPGNLTWPQCSTKPLDAKVLDTWSYNVFRRTSALAVTRLPDRFEEVIP